MKMRVLKTLYICFIATIVLGACKHQEPPFFNAKGNGAYFDYKDKKDFSTTVNWADLLLLETDTYPVNIKVKLLGYLPQQDETLKIHTRAVKGHSEVDVVIPDIIFHKGEYEKEIAVEVSKIPFGKEVAAVELYIDTVAVKGTISGGIKGRGSYIIYVKNNIVKPSNWDYGIGNTVGEWSIDKQVFLTRVTKAAKFYQNNDWSKYYEINKKAVDSVRVYKQNNPGTELSFAFPFIDGVVYNKPYYWNNDVINYIGEYNSPTFIEIAAKWRMFGEEGLNTNNEALTFTPSAENLRNLNKKAVEYMATNYNTWFFDWGQGGDLSLKMFIPFLTDINYSLPQPRWWFDFRGKKDDKDDKDDKKDDKKDEDKVEDKTRAYSLLANLVTRGDDKDDDKKDDKTDSKDEKGGDKIVIGDVVNSFYGDFSNDKYLFMIRSCVEVMGSNNFKLQYLFPFKTNGGWDQALGGEEKMKECYRIIYNKWNASKSAYNFVFPELNF